jgi:hypothetical protein
MGTCPCGCLHGYQVFLNCDCDYCKQRDRFDPFEVRRARKFLFQRLREGKPGTQDEHEEGR